MIKVCDEIPDWAFEGEEVSANVYKVTGRDKFGRSVFRTGVDLDELFNDCKEDAMKISQQI